MSRPSARITSSLTGTQDERFVAIDGRAGYPPHRVNNTLKAPGVEETTAPSLGHVGYSWEGITNWEVPGSAAGGDEGTGEPDPDNRPVLYLHGNKHNAGEPGEAPPQCTGKGGVDVTLVGCGPYLHPGALSLQPLGASWGTPISPLVNGVNDRSPYRPELGLVSEHRSRRVSGRRARPARHDSTVQGPMTVEWWASTRSPRAKPREPSRWAGRSDSGPTTS